MRFHSTITSKLQDSRLFEGFPQAEIADRLTVVILLILCSIGFFTLPTVTSKFNNDISVKAISIIALALVTLTISWSWGDTNFLEYEPVLWFGWGDKFALLTLFIALLLTYLLSSHLYKIRDSDRSDLAQLMNVGSYVVLLCYYLPSAIQPFKGIIDPYHSRYVLNDLLITASGKMPYSEIVPAYVGVLGWPLQVFSFLPNELIVHCVFNEKVSRYQVLGTCNSDPCDHDLCEGATKHPFIGGCQIPACLGKYCSVHEHHARAKCVTDCVVNISCRTCVK